VQGEIRPSLIRSIRKLLSAGDAAYPSGYAARYFHKKRARLVAELFAGLSKGRRVSKPKATINGFKTPLAEHYRTYVREIVGESFVHTNYLYCIRNIVDCYLSLIEMPWFVEGPNAYITSYINSLNDAVALQEHASTGGARLSIGVLNLDDFIRCDAKAEWVAERLFAPLPVKLEPGWIDEIVGTTDNRNATEKATGKRRKKELAGPAAEVFLHRRSEIEQAVSRFNAAFSENLTCKLPSTELVA
jgi:hypothetical protein